MRTALVVGLGISAMGLAACGDVDWADANLSTAPLWTISNGTASLVMPAQVPSESQGVLRIDNHHLSYSFAYDQDLAREMQYPLGAVDSVLEYSDDDRAGHFLPPPR